MIRKKTALFISILIYVLFLTACSDDTESVTKIDTNEARFNPISRTVSFEPIEPAYETNDDRINMIEVNQALSYGKDGDSGDYYLMDNFVAGKEAGIFVSFNDTITTAEYETMLLTIEKNGEYLTELIPETLVDESLVLFQPRNIADVDYWEEGAYSFTFTCGDITAVRNTNFYPSKSIKILAVPVIANYSGEVIACEGEWKSGAQMVYASYPLARSNIEYILGPEIDLSDDMYDLNDSDGQYNVWDALVDLQTPNKDYELIIGFIREGPDNGRLAGYTYGFPANIVVESDADMTATVAHEIAHCYTLGDEYDGGSLNPNLNPPPYGMEGRMINSGEEVIGMKKMVIGGEDAGIVGTGSVIEESQHPYWAEQKDYLGSVTSFMGAGTGADSSHYWATSDIWNRLYGVFVGEISTSFSSSDDDEEEEEYWGQCTNCYDDILDPEFYGECYECGEDTELYDLAEDVFICEYCDEENDLDLDILYLLCDGCEYLIPFYNLVSDDDDEQMKGRDSASINAIDITGYIDQAGEFHASLWYSYESDSSGITSSKTGDYGVYFYDASDKQTSYAYFNPKISVHAKSSSEQNRLPVDVTVRFPDNTQKIVIKKGDKEIYSVNVSDNVPEVSFTGMKDYDELGDKYTLHWESSDADGDELFYELWYCPAEDEFYNIASGITGNSYEVDLSVYPGSNEGYFYIYVTDGIRTGENDSPFVKVNYKAPEIISEQTSVPEYTITDSIRLNADIYDIQDGWLVDEEISWTLNGREFMSGSYLWIWPYELSPGEHVFTLTATNSQGKESKKDFTYKIVNDESALPDDWSRDDVKNALSNGFVAPLASIESPITRGQFAMLMSYLFQMVSLEEDPYPEYEEGLVTDCGFDDYDQFLMVKLGVMEAENGKFKPNDSLSQEEAAIIMYQVMGLGDSELVYEFDDNEEIIDLYLYNEIITEDGPNGYQADKKITSQLALVRCNRLFKVLYDET